ncbi:pentapeptide repeat-containing protein [Leptolyngbya sp. Heron Island J]|uniref:pentapeptide repeat-containing protein n=1 Tax=Leptolyngbya sp. Heron Island J TaxID=1385935 RepID=UPI0004077198|nr:pentapeptide repeat-containing protein [Leptolyngbya sp. Heron Island J]
MATDISVDLDRLDLREILLRGSDTWNQWRKENPNDSIELRGADLRGADLRGADLRGADLSEADLSRANLSRAQLSRAQLRGANLLGANLTEAQLRGAYLSGAYLSEANLFGADLSGAQLRGAQLRGAYLLGADLSGADLSEANLSRANLSRAQLSRAQLLGADLSGAELRGAELLGAELLGADLSEANLFGAYLTAEETFGIKIFDQEIDPRALEKLKTALSNYAEAAGYTDPEILSEKRGSFFSRIRYKVAKILTPEVMAEAAQEGEDFYRRGKENLKAQLEKTGVESTQKLANATAELLKAVENFDNVVLTLGKLIVVKHTAPDCEPRIIVRTVSTEIQNTLESTPHILDDPRTLLAFLQRVDTVTQDTPLPIIPEERQIG